MTPAALLNGIYFLPRAQLVGQIANVELRYKSGTGRLRKSFSWNTETRGLLSGMPRYFCDLKTNGQIIPDVEGVDLAGLDAAIDEAVSALATIFPTAMAAVDGNRWEATIHVRDEAGRIVFDVVLTLAVTKPYQ